MKSKLPPHLQSLVETLCESGCENVNGIIENLSRNQTSKETRDLDEQEKEMVLNELKNIMSVYDQ